MTQHEPGRALDALVAEKAMGYTWWHRPGGRNHLYEPESFVWAIDAELTPGKGTIEAEPILGVPHFSTDMTAAQRVLLRMEKQPEGEQEAFINELIKLVLGQDALWRHKTRGLYGDQILALLNASPHAICLAALKACDE